MTHSIKTTDCHLTRNTSSSLGLAAPLSFASGGHSIPYTHAIHARRCRDAALSRVLLVQHVQVLIKSVSCCAKIKEAWTPASGADLWRVELLNPLTGLTYVSASKVRQCSDLDGQCSCANECPTANTRSEASMIAVGARGGAKGVTCL